MTKPPSFPFLKILRIAGISLLIGLALIAISLVAGKAWLEHRFLRQEIRFGENSVRIYGGELNWALRFQFDSAWYRAPGLQARIGKTDVHLGLPLSVKAQVDTAFVLLIASPDTRATAEKTKPPLRFPNFEIPVPAQLKVRAFAVENDSGALVSGRNFEIENAGARKMRATVETLSSPLAGNLKPSLSVNLDWTSGDSVDLEIVVVHEKDRVQLKTRHARADLMRGRAALLAQMADSRIYTKALGIEDKKLPYSLDSYFEIQAVAADSLQARAVLKSRVQGFPDSLPLNLSPQMVEFHFDWWNQSGRWNLHSQGKTREELSLLGNLGWIQLPAGDSLTPLWKRFTASALGYARNFQVRTAGKIMRAEVRLENAQWNGKVVSVQIRTGDSSQVRVQAFHANRDWVGKFSVRLNPGERWITAFVDTSISFSTLKADGTVQGKSITAAVAAKKVSAYGVHVDSLASEHVYGPRGYELTSASLYAGGEIWSLTGKMESAKSSPLLDSRLESPSHGSVEYVLNRDGSMRANAEHFETGTLPYDLTKNLPVQNPVVNGTFEWNPKRRTGATDMQVTGEFKNENVGVQAKAHWDAQYLDAEKVKLDVQGSSLNVQARLHMKGKQFYELANLRLPDYESVALETQRFDLAHALSLFQTQPVLKSGEMQGNFGYADAGGFRGSLNFTKVALNEEIGDLVLKRLQIDGTGDTLTVLAVTTSETTPLLKDSLRIAVTHVLEGSQKIRVDARAADSLHLHMDAVSSHLQSLQGRLQVQGKVPLPENSGLLEHVNVDADVFIPFQHTLEKATLTTRSFEGDYAIPPATREHFSLDPALLNGTLRIPHLTLKDEKGRMLQGEAEYGIQKSALRADISGGDFAMQWTENRKVALRDVRLECLMDSNGMRIKGGFSDGSVLYVDPPLHAEGDLSSVAFAFTQPPRSRIRTGKEYPALQFSGSLSQSLIRYRIKSLSVLQNFFKKEGDKKRNSGKIRPMQMDVKLHTRGDSNHVDSDVLRLNWVGDVELHGLYPYALMQGRINSLNGELGIENQAYAIRQLEVKWLNAPPEEGEAHLEARKKLASRCNNNASTNPAPQDSCVVITRLQGPLSQLQFSYDSDCGGAFGAGASVSALIYSVQRGCYDPAFANGGGPGYGGKALSLLEPTVNNNLSKFVGRHSFSWISQTEITGLSSLAGHDSATDSLSQALSLQVTSKELLHFRLKLRSGYHVESQDLSNPWENMAALEWRPPLQNYLDDPDWKERLQDHVSVAASVQSLPVQRNMPAQDPVEKMLALNYTYDFWGLGWGRPAKQVPKKDTTSKTGEKIP